MMQSTHNSIRGRRQEDDQESLRRKQMEEQMQEKKAVIANMFRQEEAEARGEGERKGKEKVWCGVSDG